MTWATVDSFDGNSSSPDAVVHRQCPLCGGGASRPLLELEDFQFFTDSREEPKRVGVRSVQCRSCFLMFMNPCYSQYGFGVLFAQAEQSYGASVGRYAEQMRWLEERGLLAGGSGLLDVGCYDGGFLAELPAGVRRMGVDIDRHAIDRAKALLGGDAVLVCGDFESFELAEQPDAIVMFHVLEHLARPVEVLRKLRALAGPDTRLIVEVPVVERGDTNDLVGFMSVQHLTHFSTHTLERCLVAAGWELVEAVDVPGYNGRRVVAAPGVPAPTVTGEPLDVASAHRCLEAWHAAAAGVGARLERLRGAPRVAVWGAGLHTEYLYQRTAVFQADPQREYVLVDSDPVKQGGSWRGIHIGDPQSLAGLVTGDVPLLVSTYGSQESISDAAASIGVPDASIVRLYKTVSVY